MCEAFCTFHSDSYCTFIVNHPPGTNVEVFPELPGATLARLSITELDGKSPQPYSLIDARQFRTSLPGELWLDLIQHGRTTYEWNRGHLS